MSKRKDIIKILQICEEYDPDEWICAEHDVIYVLRSDVKVSDEDKNKLDELGASKSSEGWMVFV